MSPEEIWQKCTVGLRNTALEIARTYNHGWSRSSAVPASPNFWKYNDPVPTLEEIEEGTPVGPLGRGITGPNISFEDGRYVLRHTTLTGRVYIEVSIDPINDFGYRYKVVVSRPSGAKAIGVRIGPLGDKVETSADDSTWGIRHEDAWKRAWCSIGIFPPEFPGEILENSLLVKENGLSADPLHCKVTIFPSAVLSGEDLLKLRSATSVELVDRVGKKYDLTIG
jgi:hypothetical protein